MLNFSSSIALWPLNKLFVIGQPHSLLQDGPPNSPLVKINCDDAIKENTIAIAIVRCDSSGSILHVYHTPCHAFSPLHAEVAISLSSTDTVPPWSIDALVDDICLWSKIMNLTFSWTS
ncbi:hypothetical protein Tco_0127958 [Tanacetum coccineum]